MAGRIGLLLASLLSIVALLPGERGEAQEKKVYGIVRLGSWNIENLGNPKDRHGPGEGVLQDPKDLAHYLRHARLDMLAVQEVRADGPTPDGFPKAFRTNTVLTKTLGELNRGGGSWKHVLFPRSRAGEQTQWTGLAWNESKVKPEGDVFHVPVSHARSSQGSALWDKNLHAMKFSAGKDRTDFVVMVVHLKANTTDHFDKQRAEEVKDLVDQMPALEKRFPKERDLVVVGDTNMEGLKEPAVEVLDKAGFRDLNTGIDTHTARGAQFFDRVFVPKDQPEFAKSKLEVLSDFQKKESLSFAEFRKRYSDHYNVVTEIQVMDDDV